MKYLKETRQETMEAWANQEYIAATGEQTLQFNAKALGGIDLLDKLFALLDTYKPALPTQEPHHDTASY